MSTASENYGGAFDPVLVPAALRGYRRWNIKTNHPQGVLLHSIGRTYCWPGPSVIAECLNSKDHAVPAKDCSCGVYACHSAVDEQVRAQPVTARPENSVFGVIEATGNIEVGRRGFRAEKARMVALCVSHSVEILNIQLETLESMPSMWGSWSDLGSIGAMVTYRVKGAFTPESFHLRSRGASQAYAQQMLVQELRRREMELLAQYPGVELIPSVEELLEKYPEQSVAALLPEGVEPYTEVPAYSRAVSKDLLFSSRYGGGPALQQAIAAVGAETVENLKAMKNMIDQFVQEQFVIQTEFRNRGRRAAERLNGAPWGWPGA